jgi:hypothetical protein
MSADTSGHTKDSMQTTAMIELVTVKETANPRMNYANEQKQIENVNVMLLTSQTTTYQRKSIVSMKAR